MAKISQTEIANRYGIRQHERHTLVRLAAFPPGIKNDPNVKQSRVKTEPDAIERWLAGIERLRAQLAETENR